MVTDNRDAAMGGEGAKPKSRRWVAVIVVLAIVLVGCIVAGLAGGMYLVKTYTQISDIQNSQNLVPALPDSASDVAADDSLTSSDDNTGVIDFESLKDQNPDIYAWLYIPGTHVNYPVCQNASDDTYYLSHSASLEESEVGAIFSEAQFNHADFSDRVTVLYGHNGFSDVMFSDLHEYERQEFFDSHDKLYVYLPGHVITYQVFSAFATGERHIMDAFNFTTDEGFMTFVDYLKAPDSIDIHVSDVPVGASDKLLVLSTCNTGPVQAEGRYLVCGVQIDDQPID